MKVRINFNDKPKKININLSKVDKIAVVITSHKYKGKRKPRKIFTFNSHVQVFYDYADMARFALSVINILNKERPGEIHEVHYVSLNKAIEPSHDLVTRDKYYCPYCGEVNYLEQNNVTGYKVCPVCGCSMNEYYFMSYNGLWHKDQKQANTGKKIRKRRSKKNEAN